MPAGAPSSGSFLGAAHARRSAAEQRRLEVRALQARLHAGDTAPPARRAMALVLAEPSASSREQALHRCELRGRREPGTTPRARHPADVGGTHGAHAELEWTDEHVAQLRE